MRTGARTHDGDQEGLASVPLPGELAASHHSWSEYERAIAAIDAAGGDLLAPLARTATWTSAATHAVLPLLATDAGIRLQVGTGAASHRRRAGHWGGGLWLPECAWDPELEAPLIEEGVRTVCVELTGAGTHRAPWQTPDGLRILPIDRPLIDLVWHHTGYPSHGDYRSSHARSYQGHALWSNDHQPYDPERGAARARADAAHWAAACADALADGTPRIVAFDTELFGHWWHEGPAFLEAAIHELAAAASSSSSPTTSSPPPPSTPRPPRPRAPGAPAVTCEPGAPRRSPRSRGTCAAPNSTSSSPEGPAASPKRRSATSSPSRAATGPSWSPKTAPPATAGTASPSTAAPPPSPPERYPPRHPGCVTWPPIWRTTRSPPGRPPCAC